MILQRCCIATLLRSNLEVCTNRGALIYEMNHLTQTSTVDTYSQKHAFVLFDRSAASKKSNNEQETSHGDDEVDSVEDRWVITHDLLERISPSSNPDADPKQRCSTEL